MNTTNRKAYKRESFFYNIHPLDVFITYAHINKTKKISHIYVYREKYDTRSKDVKKRQSTWNKKKITKQNKTIICSDSVSVCVSLFYFISFSFARTHPTQPRLLLLSFVWRARRKIPSNKFLLHGTVCFCFQFLRLRRVNAAVCVLARVFIHTLYIYV